MSTFFLFLSVLELRQSSTQAKEAKVVLAAIIVFIAAITHIVITNRVSILIRLSYDQKMFNVYYFRFRLRLAIWNRS